MTEANCYEINSQTKFSSYGSADSVASGLPGLSIA